MKKVFIICDMFPPAFGPRMGYLCKYLPLYGWKPVVLAETVKDNHDFRFLKGETPVTYIDFYPSEKKQSKIHWLITFLRDFLFGYKDNRMCREAKNILQGQEADLILCSTFRTFPLKAAGKLAKESGLPLVVDLRDIIEQYTGHEYISHRLPSLGGLERFIVAYFRRKNLRIRDKVLSKASFVTTISPWHVDVLKKVNPNTTLIYNGYDPELFYPEQAPTPKFIVTYTGRLLSVAMRDPSLFLLALARLEKEGVITPKDCEVHWYVDSDSWELIKKEAGKAGVSPFMAYKGHVPAPEIPHILNISSVLLLLTNKASGDGPKGIMTTKLFESLSVEKPILCVRSDESFLEDTIRKTKTGIAARTLEEAYDFILYHYNEWKKHSYTTIQADRQVVESFSRKKQAEQFTHIFDKLT